MKGSELLTGAVLLGSAALLMVGRLNNRGFFLWLRTVGILGLLVGILSLALAVLTGSAIAGLVVGVITATMMYMFSSRIVRIQMGAVDAEEFLRYKPEYADKLRRVQEMVSKLASKAGLPEPELVVVPEETGVGMYPNAFATGRQSKPTVGVTEGLLEHLDDEEIYGVLGHELAHVKNRDTLVMTVAAAVSTAIAYAFDPWLNAIYAEDWEDVAYLVLAGTLASLISTLLVAAISRSREYLADEEGAKLSENPMGLAEALEKIEAIVKSNPTPAKSLSEVSTAHLWIENPFRGGLLRLFSTHPPVEKRVKRLRRLARELQ
ncbi:M48 family metalloprotease [Methanopyrus sp. KOL6]|uniref:M48 family metalloprotease n=1 Tax=Methanopyrus sp. KOL6 TaxID=1937004 RepID=UPI0018DF4A7C|nr:M48 family metalloprotease [Methanopyrus sp. KOL6]